MVNRAYYALPNLTSSEGLHTGAVYGFLNIMIRFLGEEQPTHLAVCFDLPAPTFRHKMFPDYKGTRHKMPPELLEQIPMVKEILEAMGIPIVEQEGLEADDLLGSLARKAEQEGASVVILSGDRDLLQIASEQTKISIPHTKKGETEVLSYYAKDVLADKGVTPEEFIDVKALMGDSADNIPGVPGIGEKTATAIIQKYHSLENAIANVSQLRPPRASKNLEEYASQARLSRTLATIKTDARLDVSMEDFVLGDIYTPGAHALVRKWEFKNLLSRFSREAKQLEAEAGASVSDGFVLDAVFGQELEDALRAFLVPEGGQEQVSSPPVLGMATYCLDGFFLGTVLSFGGHTCYIERISPAHAAKLCRMLADAPCVLAVHELKEQLTRLFHTRDKAAKELVQLFLELPDERLFDDAIAAYVLNPTLGSYPTEQVAKPFFGEIIPSYVDLFGKKKPREAYDTQKADMQRLVCFEAAVAAGSCEGLVQKLKETGQFEIFAEIEMPLVRVLYEMEREGILASKKELKEYGEKLVSRIEELTERIYESAGETFNINSPKQLGVILFEKMGLPGAKKTKTGYSTSADILEKLAPSVPFVKDILEYRQLTKLKSTYADGLAACIAEDGRIHTTFQQTVTATGRLSSTDPNLQNIPIRVELGRAIRKVFYPGAGKVFVDADYSQIELRVLAHISGDENLIRAYQENKDIHTATASLVFHTPYDEVSEIQRRNAKAVNFGIVYGISAHGLSQDLGVSRKEAQKYIDDYFLAYPKLKVLVDGLVESAKACGYARTIYGRRRPVPELSSSNFVQRSFGERVAMNAPIQGTAADIIKRAMLLVYRRIKEEGLSSRLVLQVHDELLVEAEQSEAERVRQILDEEMGRAGDLLVPLSTHTSIGESWYEAK